MGWLFPIYGKIKNVSKPATSWDCWNLHFWSMSSCNLWGEGENPTLWDLARLAKMSKTTSKNSSDIYGHVSKSTVPTPKLYSLVLHPGKWIIIPVLSEVALLAHLYSGLIVGWITKTTNWSIASSFLAHAEFSKQIWQTLFLRSRYQIVPISTKHGDCLISSTDSREIDRNITMQSVESIWNIAIQLVVFRLPQPEKWWSEWVTVGMIFYSLFCFWKVIKFHGINMVIFVFHVFSMGEKLSSTHPRRSFNSLGSSDWSRSLRESLATLPGLVFPMENPVENPLENQHHCKCSQYPLVN